MAYIDYLKNAGSNLNTTTIIIISVVLFAIVAGLYYYYYILPQIKKKYKPNNEHLQNNSDHKNAEVLYFYTDWCPHCKTCRPIWDDLKTEYQNKKINGYDVMFTEINCTEETAEVEQMMTKYNVEGYPTIKLLKNGNVIDYDAKPTKENLTQFLNTVLE